MLGKDQIGFLIVELVLNYIVDALSKPFGLFKFEFLALIKNIQIAIEAPCQKVIFKLISGEYRIQSRLLQHDIFEGIRVHNV
jgi:hypothetical protein